MVKTALLDGLFRHERPGPVTPAISRVDTSASAEG